MDPIIEAKGVVVPGMNLRSGLRYVSLKGDKPLQHKPRQSQRKNTITLPPVHRHCFRALQMVKNGKCDAEVHRIADEAQVEALRDPLDSDDEDEDKA